MLKHFLSYLFPQILVTKPSKVSGELSIVISDGKMLLNTANANYSYGSLQRILEKGLTRIGKPTIEKMESALILGVAGGSVIESLYNKYNYSGKIVGVELDDKVIELSKAYLGLDKYPNFHIVIDDAQNYIAQHHYKYDLIVIDIFKDVQMPSFLFQEDFINNLKYNLKPKGYILFNTMVTTNVDKIRNEKYLKNFNATEFEIICLPLLEKYNEVILIRKK